MLLIGGFYLPEASAITYEYIADILAGRRKLLKVEQLNTLTMPPKVEGLRLSTLWEEVRKDQNIAVYFPPYHGRMPSKEYFFNVCQL